MKNSENKILNELKLVIPNAASWMATFIKCHFSVAFKAVYLQLDRLLIGDKKIINSQKEAKKVSPELYLFSKYKNLIELNDIYMTELKSYFYV